MNPTTTTLRQDLAALQRVRNRLASTPDPAFGNVLEKLLPKLVTRINDLAPWIDERCYEKMVQQQGEANEQYAATVAATATPSHDDSSSEMCIRLEMIEHLHGMWKHVQERNQLLPPNYRSVAWMHAVWEQASVDATVMHPWTWYLVLPALEAAQAQWEAATVTHYLLPTLEQLHITMQQTNQKAPLAAVVAENWYRISSMVLDSMALSAGLPAWFNVERNGGVSATTFGNDDALSWNKTEAAAQPASFPMQSSTAGGLLDLLLDVALFVPTNNQQQGGLSTAGNMRLNYRRRLHDSDDPSARSSAAAVRQPVGRHPIPNPAARNHLIRQHTNTTNRVRPTETWSDTEINYWRHVKFAVLRYCIPNLLPANQIMALCILLQQTQPDTRQGQMAAEYIWSWVGGRKLVRIKGQRFGPAKPPPCRLEVALFLLGLVVGHAATRSAVDALGLDAVTARTVLVTTFMECPQNAEHQRPPLPHDMAGQVLAYLQENMALPVMDNASTVDTFTSLRLLVELAQRVGLQTQENQHLDVQLLMADPASARICPAIRWTMHLWYKLFQQYAAAANNGLDKNNNEWILLVQNQSWKTAMNILRKVHDENDQRMHRSTRRDRNHTVERLILENRRQMGQRSPVLLDCVVARREAYEVVATLAGPDKIRKAGTTQIDFDPLICLIQCLGNDTHCDVQQSVLKAAERFAQIYMAQAPSMVMGHRESRQIMNKLLFPLMNAATSKAETAREVAAVVAAHVLGKLDPLPARHLCIFLARDKAPAVAKRAMACVNDMGTASEEELARDIKVECMDLARTADFEYLKTELSTRTELLASSLGITADAAYFLLRRERFSVTETVSAIQKDYHGYLRECGLYNRIAGASQRVEQVPFAEHMCEICYETVSGDDVFALSCEHIFCKDCWSDAIDAAFIEREAAMNSLTCPRHDCNERLTRGDIEFLSVSNLAKWDELAVQDFIRKSPDYSFCPGADCSVVACLASDTSKNHPARCVRCDSSFCFQCGKSPPHRPATCDVVKRYESIMKEFHDMDYIIKDCPSCQVQIQRNGGCNHLTCAHCGHEFCWVCLSPNWQDHNCNLYSELEEREDNKRARFFSNRVNAHRMSERYARDGLERLNKTVNAIITHYRTADGEAVYDTLESAMQILLDARNFLLNSYIAAFGLNRGDAYREEFETHQAQVEMLTERLSLLTENIEGTFQSGEESDLESCLKAVTLTSGALSLYIRRVDLFMSNFMS